VKAHASGPNLRSQIGDIGDLTEPAYYPIVPGNSATMPLDAVSPSPDCDFNQATPHPADPIKCHISTQRTEAPDDVALEIDLLSLTVRNRPKPDSCSAAISTPVDHLVDIKPPHRHSRHR